MFKQPERYIKMAIFMLPLPTEATIDETNVCGSMPSYIPLKTTNYSRKSTQMAMKRLESLE